MAKFEGKQIDKVVSTGTGLVAQLPGVVNNTVSSVTNVLPWIAAIGAAGLIGYSYLGRGTKRSAQNARMYEDLDSSKKYKYIVS